MNNIFSNLIGGLNSKIKMNTIDKKEAIAKRIAAKKIGLPKPTKNSVFVNPTVEAFFDNKFDYFDSKFYLEMKEDYLARAEVGKEKYGTYLTTFNSRGNELGPWLDTYQEALDGIAYSTQGILESEKGSQKEGAFIKIRDHFFEAAYMCKLYIDILS